MAGVLEVYSVFEQAYNIYIGGRDRLEKYCGNPELANRLALLFKRLLDELALLADKCNNNAIKLPDEHLQFYTVRVEALNKNMTETCEKLQKKIKQLNSPFYRLGRAISTSDWLSKLETDALRADELLREITTCFVNATLISQQTEEVTAAMAKHTETVAKAVMTGSEYAREVNFFCPSFDVPDNPPHVVLNFQSTSESEQGASQLSTSEAKLKSFVLNSDGYVCIGAVGSPLAHAIGTEGMSGVGKSCAVRGLARDPEVKERFRDGIYYVILGKDAKEATAVQQIAKVIKASGGTRMAREVLEEGSVEAAVFKARKWFAGKCILLLIDDAWEGIDSDRDLVARLSSIVDIDGGSRVVFTTRDVRIGMRSKLIHFSARDAKVSLQILLASAGLCEEEVDSFRDTVEDVLDVCCGLPMALAIAGSAIKLQLALQLRYGSSKAEILRSYLSELRTHCEYLLRDTVDNDAYENLSSAFMTSLSMLDKNIMRRLPFQHSMTFSEMYRALLILQRQGWVPVTVLERVWDTEDEYETLRVLQELVNANLAQREDRMVNGKKTAGISLHDLHLNFVKDECRKYGESEKWHRKLLEKYLPEKASSIRQGLAACRDWWKDEVFEDEYIRNNVSRHLLKAGLGNELHCLLRNPNWAARRLCAHEILELEDDIGMMAEQLKRESTRDVGRGADELSLKMMAGAARLSSPYVSRNAGEVWFQLYARLLGLSEQLDAIRKYLADIERCAERPWVKALSACLPGPDGALKRTVICDERVKWISQVDDDGKLTACGTDGYQAFVSTVMDGQVEKTVWLSMRGVSSRTASDNTSSAGSATPGDVSAVCISRDEILVAIRPGAIQMYNTETSVEYYDRSSDTSDDGLSENESSAEYYNRSSDASDDGSSAGSATLGEVSAMCCRRDGNRVVTGHKDGAIQLWDAETGEPVGDTLRGHVAGVTCVAFSADGRRVASGSDDLTVQLWDAETGEPVGDALRGHVAGVTCVAFSADGRRVASGSDDLTLQLWDAETGEPVGAPRGHVAGVRCVAFSADGRRVASGSDDLTQLWDAETGEPVGDALRGHVAGVRCVAFSADGRRLASGSDDLTVQLWDVETGESVGEGLRGHTFSVTCVAWSADGRHVAAGSSRDNTVRVWNAENGALVDDAPQGHDGEVTTLAFSADGRRVATGSENMTVCVWDAKTGEQVGEQLRGHSGLVACVALSAHGKRVASVSMDMTLRVWDVETGEPVCEVLSGHVMWIVSVAMSVDGSRVASGSMDLTSRVWDVDTGELLRVDDWTPFNTKRLRFLLMEEGAAAEEDQEERRVTFENACVKYGSQEDGPVLATLEGPANWKYSEVNQRIVSGATDGSVDFYELVL